MYEKVLPGAPGREPADGQDVRGLVGQEKVDWPSPLLLSKDTYDERD